MKKSLIKTAALILLLISFSDFSLAAEKLSASRLFLLNYDANSEAMGGTIASFSRNSLAFTNMPSSNFSVLSARLDFGGIMGFDGVHGIAGSFMMPTSYGNFTAGAAYNDFESNLVVTPDDQPLNRNLAFYLNYVYPLSSNMPIYEDKGGIGLTIKAYQFVAEEESAMTFAADIGGHYKLDMLLNNLWAFVALKNLGSSVEIVNTKAFDIPGSFNLALRYEIPVFFGLAFTGDLVQFFSEGTGVALGAEISPVYPVTLKFGWKNYGDGVNVGATGGLFLNFDAFNIGYSFASAGRYLPKHTVNFGFMFGGVNNENKAFDYYLGSNFNRAKEAYDRKDYINARQQLEEILAVYPDHGPSKEYLKKIVYDMDMYDRSLDIQTQKWLSRADLELHRNNLIKARRYYYQVLGIDPENQEAEEGLDEVSERISRVEIQQNRKKNEKQIITLWNEAMGYYKEGNFVFAKDKFKDLLEIDPENAGAIKYLDTIETQVSKVTAMQADQLFTQGMEYYNMADYDRAAKYFNAVYASDPSRIDAKEYYELSRRALNQAYTEISKKEARTAPKKTRLTEKDDSILSSTQKVQKEMEESYNRAVDLFNKGKYEEALTAFVSLREKAMRNSFYDLNQSIRDFSTRARDALAERNYKEALALIKNNKEEEALAKLNKALDYNKSYQTAIREKDRLLNSLAQYYYESGIKAYSSGNKKKSLELLEKSLEFDPNKTESIKAIERIKILGG